MSRKGVSQRGFSLIELVFATGVLGIGLLGLVNLHRSAVMSVTRGEAIALATEIGTQRVEYLATMHADDLPACTGQAACSLGGGTDFAPPLNQAGAFECTRWVNGADVPMADGTNQEQGVRFRVDTVVGRHPDTLRQPNASVITVSVCWLDGDTRVRQIQTRRMVIPGA